MRIKNKACTKILVILVFCCLFAAYGQNKAYAADIGVGATTWYTYWDPDFNPSFLYGPTLSAKLNDDFNLTFLFLYGEFDSKDSPRCTYRRYDSDLAINYKIDEYLKIFLGIKYLGFSARNDDRESSAYGPGAGITATIPVADNLFILGNVAYMYLWSNEKRILFQPHFQMGLNDYAINSSLSLAYYIARASTVISLGGRFQYLSTNFDSSYSTNNKFYGVTLSATYTFSI